MIDLWPTVGQVLAAQQYLVLGTADGGGKPWATPVFFAAAGEHTLYWVSAREARHSRNLAVRSAVAMTVFDSRAAVGVGDAVYLEGVARVVTGEPARAGLAALNGRLAGGHRLGDEDLTPDGPLDVYRADVSRHHVLVRGGDERFDNVVDGRVEVHDPTRRAFS